MKVSKMMKKGFKTTKKVGKKGIKLVCCPVKGAFNGISAASKTVAKALP